MKQQKRNYASGMNFNDDFDTEREGRSSKRQVRSLGVEQYYRQRRLNFCTTREASERKPTQPIDLRSQFLCCPFSLARAALNRASTIRACCGDAKWWCPWRECQVCACILTWLPTKATGMPYVGGAVTVTMVATTPSLYTKVFVIEFVVTLYNVRDPCAVFDVAGLLRQTELQ